MEIPVPVTKWTRSDEKFSPFATGQLPHHCGPCSLSGCLFMLGIEATQRDLATAAGKPYKIFRKNGGGVPEDGLIRAARAYGVDTEELKYLEKSSGREFAARIRDHLRERGPVIIITQDFNHWIAVVGHLPKKAKFVVYDPSAENAFGLWGEKHFLHRAWNMPEDDPPEFYGLLFRHRDGKPPAWTITERWMKIHDRGSDCTAATIASDLHDLVSNACGGSKRRNPLGATLSDGIPLATLLGKYRRQVLEAILYWGEGAESNDKRDLRDLYADYMVCAEACHVRFPDNGDQVLFAAGLTALFSSYWWGAEMG